MPVSVVVNRGKTTLITGMTMDCFIIRVYRHITQENGQPDEIAGLVERVGRKDNGKPFSSYKGLLCALRDEYGTVSAAGEKVPDEDAARMRLVQTTKQL